MEFTHFMSAKRSVSPDEVSPNGPRYIGFRLCFRLMMRSLFGTRGTAAPLTWKRFAIVAFVLPWGLPLIVVHRVALFLDNILFPGYRNVEIREPVFMVGIPRSGTTFLFHLLSKDSDTFTSFCLWELIFAPSILERKFWTFMGRIDTALGSFGYRALVRIEDRLLAKTRTIHHMSLFAPDEDEWVLITFFATALLIFPFPFPEDLWSLIRFDAALAPELKRRVMALYKACVQRHLYFHGPEKRFLSKNPLYSSKIDALGETFPDARVICNVRNPYQAAPSLMSLLIHFWGIFGNEAELERFRDLSLEVVQHFYRHPLERLSQWPADRHAFVRYDDLAPAPREVVRGLYERLGLPMDEAFDQHLREEQDRSRSYKSAHAYTLGQYELTPGRILEEFRDVFDHYGFEKAI